MRESIRRIPVSRRMSDEFALRGLGVRGVEGELFGSGKDGRGEALFPKSSAGRI